MRIDYADMGSRDLWLRHPVYGDPSFDAFEHDGGNPVWSGRPPYEWPVNGFLFKDSAGTGLYLYVGHYARGYASDKDAGSLCTVFRSTDEGRTWKHLGPVFPPGSFRFSGFDYIVNRAPDVSVIYHGGRYHMAYDWASENTRWETAFSPREDYDDSGFAYAAADLPEGPFIRERNAVWKNSGNRQAKYRRFYATSLQKRKDDFIFLILADSDQYFGWALYAMTAPEPRGPFSRPVCLLSPESHHYHPPLMEFFPTFLHDGYVYAPATSVARNRNFQMIWRAPLERAEDPACWELYIHGSVWHSEPVDNERCGIWGQTFSGYVDEGGMFHVMFPSKDGRDRGTINLARRRWDKPYRSGFAFSGHEGPSVTLIGRAYRDFALKASFSLKGSVALLWGYRGALGPDKPASGSSAGRLALSSCGGIEIREDGWRLFRADRRGRQTVKGAGSLPGAPSELTVAHGGGFLEVGIDGHVLWKGPWKTAEGPLGLYAAPHSHIRMNGFTVEGEASAAVVTYLYNEALTGAAQHIGHFREVRDTLFRFGRGKVSTADAVRMKWNFAGTGFSLWSPRGPGYGRLKMTLDGGAPEELDLMSDEPRRSCVVAQIKGLADGFHCLVLEPVTGAGAVPVDSLDVFTGG